MTQIIFQVAVFVGQTMKMWRDGGMFEYYIYVMNWVVGTRMSRMKCHFAQIVKTEILPEPCRQETRGVVELAAVAGKYSAIKYIGNR